MKNKAIQLEPISISTCRRSGEPWLEKLTPDAISVQMLEVVPEVSGFQILTEGHGVEFISQGGESLGWVGLIDCSGVREMMLSEKYTADNYFSSAGQGWDFLFWRDDLYSYFFFHDTPCANKYHEYFKIKTHKLAEVFADRDTENSKPNKQRGQELAVTST